MKKVKVYTRSGGQVNHIAQAKKNPEVFYFSTNEKDSHTFSSLEEAVELIENKEGFGVDLGRFVFSVESKEEGYSGLFIGVDVARNAIGRVDDIAGTIKTVKQLKPHQTTILERMTSANNVVYTGGIGAGSRSKKKVTEDLVFNVGRTKVVLEGGKKKKADQVFIDEASKLVIGKGKGSQRTNEEAVEQVAAYYGLKPEEVHQAVQDHIKGKPDLPEAGVPVQVADIDEAFCLLMSEKIKAFLLDPAIKGIVSIMPVEKAAGLPASTISNYLFGKRERIPLHHIGPVVKVLQAIGFKA